mmetsp:Transcript_11443/g.26465  ORF Transcript_11443/g.26465 Transcript_11443/m.26465 type:complete len:201 (+) Transcript_11443:1335-1937(+)
MLASPIDLACSTQSFAFESRSFSFSSISTWMPDSLTLADVTLASSCSTSLFCSARALSSLSRKARASDLEFLRNASLAAKRCRLSLTSLCAVSIKSATCWVTSSGGSISLTSSPPAALTCGGVSPLLLDFCSAFPATFLRLQGVDSARASSAKRSLDFSIATSLTMRSYSRRLTCMPCFASARFKSASRARRQASLSTLL